MAIRVRGAHAASALWGGVDSSQGGCAGLQVASGKAFTQVGLHGGPISESLVWALSQT